MDNQTIEQTVQIPNNTTSLYVGDLHPDVDEKLLLETFSTVGEIQSVHLYKNENTSVSLGYAHVTYVLREDAEMALATLNFTCLKDCPIRIMWVQLDKSLWKSGAGNVFIKNLHKNINNNMLYDTFSFFGEILSSKVAVDENNQSKGFGFVHYRTVEEANFAIRELNGKSLLGQIVYVGVFVPHSDRARQLNEREPQFNNVYVKNFNGKIGKTELRIIFEEMGKISSLVIMRDANGKSKGFGFVTFENFDSAKKAVSELHGRKFFPGKPLYVSRALKYAERQEKLRSERGESREE